MNASVNRYDRKGKAVRSEGWAGMAVNSQNVVGKYSNNGLVLETQSF